MLKSLFTYPGVLKRMRRGPLADEIDGIAANLEHAGYARMTAVRYLSLVASFSRFAALQGCVEAKRIDRGLTQHFLEDVPKSRSTHSLAHTALGHVLRYLAIRYPRVAASPPADPDGTLLSEFDVHMRDVRALQPRSREGVVREARRVLCWYREQRPGRPLSELCGTDVLAFVATGVPAYAASNRRANQRARSLSH